MRRSQFFQLFCVPACVLLTHPLTHAVLPPPSLVDGFTVFPDPSPLQKRWALAVSAVLAEMNQRDHTQIGVSQRSPSSTQAGLYNMAKVWGIHSATDLQRRLDYFSRQGASEVFNRFAREIVGVAPSKVKQIKTAYANNPHVLHQIDLVERFYPTLGSKSLVGFDLARFVMLCRAAYNAEYLTEPQVWELVYPQAILVQKTFSNWMELGNNYIIGTSFVSFSEYEKDKTLLEDTLRHLSSHSESPWVQLPWNLDLSRLPLSGR